MKWKGGYGCFFVYLTKHIFKGNVEITFYNSTIMVSAEGVSTVSFPSISMVAPEAEAAFTFTRRMVYAVYLDVQIFEAVEGNPIGFLIVAMLSGFLFFLCLIYAYPLLVRYRNSLIGTLKNSFTIARRYFLRTLFLAFILMIEIIVWIYNSTTLFIGFLIGPACIMFTIAGMALRIFQVIEKQPNTTVIRNEEEENDL